MKRFLLVATLAFSSTPFLSASPVAAQTTPNSTRSPSRAKLFDPATISQKTLLNGVRAIVEEATGSDLVSVQVWVRAGSRYETNQNNGVTHLIETLALRSSKAYPDKPAIVQGEAGSAVSGGPRTAIQALGGEPSSLTSRDSMFLSATVAAPFLSSALRILSDATLRPDLSDAKVEDAKQRVLAELVARVADPLRQATDLAYTASFSRHPYRFQTQGSPVGLAALTGNSVRAYHAARFAGSNISVVVVGDVARNTAHALIEQYFGSAPKAGAGVTIPTDAAPTTVVRQSLRGALPVSTVALAWRSPPVTEATDAVAMDMLLAHWKEGRDAKLRRILRAEALNQEEDEEAIGAGDPNESAEAAPAPGTPPSTPDNAPPENPLPLALGYDVDYLTQRDSGLFLITLVAPRDRNETVGAVLEEVNHVRDNGLTENELSRARFLLTQQYLEQSESVSGLGGALGFYEMIDSYEFATTYLDRVAKISNDDIKRVAQKYLTPDAYVQATIEGRTPPRQKDDSGTLNARLF